MNLDDEVEESLRKQTREAIETDVIETDSTPEMKHKSGPEDEKIERQSFSKTGASMTPQQVEYLVQEKTSMDNEELEKFLSGEHEASRQLENWNDFSRTEEKFVMQNFQTSGVEEIAQRLDRSKEEVEIKLKIMGLNPENM